MFIRFLNNISSLQEYLQTTNDCFTLAPQLKANGLWIHTQNETK